MARTPRTREGEEIWETTTAGRVWVLVTDERGRETARSAGGKVGSRLRITTLDREIAEDRVQEGDSAFTNGLLVRVDTAAPPVTGPTNAMTTDALVVGFSKHGNAFKTFVEALNEINLRRMRDMADVVDATTSQVALLDRCVKTYRVEGDTPTYREMKATPGGG